MSGVVTAEGGFIGTTGPLTPSTCTDWASEGGYYPGSNVLALLAPAPTAGINVQSENLVTSLWIRPYMGPRSYPTITAFLEDVDLAINGQGSNPLGWTVDGAGYGGQYWNPDAVASAKVGDDASGSITLSNLGYVNQQTGQSVINETFSGQWTCMENQQQSRDDRRSSTYTRRSLREAGHVDPSAGPIKP
jgi:hypothetical protein